MCRCAASTIWKGGPTSDRAAIREKGANLAPFLFVYDSVDLDIHRRNDGIGHRQALKQLAKMVLYPAYIDQ